MRPCSCHLPSWQARERPGRRKPAAKMAARQICPKAQKIGRARSPLPAGVVCADQASGLNQVFRALTSAATFNMEVIRSTEPKAVLEHRAPKTSPPILHSRSAESR